MENLSLRRVRTLRGWLDKMVAFCQAPLPIGIRQPVAELECDKGQQGGVANARFYLTLVHK